MIPFDLPLWMVSLFLFALGAVLGSFLNVCICRLPEHGRLADQLRGLWSPPSRCPYCRQRISGLDNIPIFGWFFVRGRCRSCRRRISLRYPLLELFNAVLFVVVFWCEVPAGWGATLADSCVSSSLGPQAVAGADRLAPVALVNWRYAYHMVLLEALVVATFIDLDRMIIPDGATLPAMTVGVAGAAGLGEMYLVPVWFQNPEVMRSLQIAAPAWLQAIVDPSVRIPAWIGRFPHLHGLAVSLAGLIVGGGLVWAVRWIGQRVLHREAMGFGDVVLMATIGSFLGWQPVVIVFFLAPVFALLTVVLSLLSRRMQEIPYGPYLSLAALTVLLGWKQIWPASERFFGLGPLLPLLGLFMGVLLVLSLQMMQLLKRILGFPAFPEEPLVARWSSADQLVHFSGEVTDTGRAGWPPGCGRDWPGSCAARGTAQSHQWRYGQNPGGPRPWSRD